MKLKSHRSTSLDKYERFFSRKWIFYDGATKGFHKDKDGIIIKLSNSKERERESEKIQKDWWGMKNDFSKFHKGNS